jgi:lipid A 3-O-deacylase
VARNTIAKTAVLAAMMILFLAGFASPPATAQITLGSPTDPPRVAVGAGAFDIDPHSRPNRTAAEFRGEYRFGDVVWVISPFIGATGTSDGAFYGYGGFGFDVNFGPNFVVTPNGAVGYFTPGSGTRLGSHVEFRTGAELAYRFSDASRLGLAVHHTSNAGITKRNPGAESVVLMYSYPLR